MRYDPNYSYDDEEEGSGGDEDRMSVDGEGSDNEEEGSGDEGSDYGQDEDDDDTSWKVQLWKLFALYYGLCLSAAIRCEEHVFFCTQESDIL